MLETRRPKIVFHGRESHQLASLQEREERRHGGRHRDLAGPNRQFRIWRNNQEQRGDGVFFRSTSGAITSDAASRDGIGSSKPRSRHA